MLLSLFVAGVLVLLTIVAMLLCSSFPFAAVFAVPVAAAAAASAMQPTLSEGLQPHLV